ncbi:MAG: hypothetical protein FWH12_00185 [Treponema sp.]|nr:hypothetical protein [Treponema sp.]
MGVKEDFSALLGRTSEDTIRSHIDMVSPGMLAKALKNLEPAIQIKVLRNMGPDSAQAVKDQMEGEIPPEDTEAAQREILSMAQGY